MLDDTGQRAAQLLGSGPDCRLWELAARLQSVVAAVRGGAFAPGDLARLQALLPAAFAAALSPQDEAGAVALVRHVARYVRDMAQRESGVAWALEEEKDVLYPDVVEASDQAWWLANQASVVAAGSRAFHDESSLGHPAGLARFCTGQAWAETELLAGLYRTAISARCAAPRNRGPGRAAGRSGLRRAVNGLSREQRRAPRRAATCREGSEDEERACSMLILHPDARRAPAPLAPALPRSRRTALPQPARAARSYLAGVLRGLDAAGVPHASVTTTDPQQVQAVLDGVTVAGLEDFLWVGSLLETFHLTRRTYPGDARQARPGARAAWQPGAPHRPCCRAVLRLASGRGLTRPGRGRRRWRRTWRPGRAWWAGASGWSAWTCPRCRPAARSRRPC